MNRIVRDFLTGLTALMGLVGLIAMLMLFGEANFIERDYRFLLRLSNAGALDDTSPVLLNGVRVGQVKGAEALQGAYTGAQVTVAIKRGINVPRAARVALAQGFVGGSSLEFLTVELTEAQLKDVIKPGETIDGGAPTTLMGSIQEIIEGPVQKLTDTAENIDRLAQEYIEVGRRLNDLLEPRTTEEVAAGKPANLRSTLARLDSAVSGAEKWLRDDELANQARDLLARANRVIDDAQELTQQWTKAGHTIEEQAQKLGTTVEQLSSNATDTLGKVQVAAADLSGVLESVKNGEGTVGQLVNNPDLYRSLTDAAGRLEKVLSEAQQLLEKYKAEGIKLKL